MPQYDITIASAAPSPTFTTSGLMLDQGAIMQDITPASTRRSDGDARFALIPTESYWGQNDWAGGYGLDYPPEPTSFLLGPADTLTPHRLKAGFAGVNASAGLNAGAPVTNFAVHGLSVVCTAFATNTWRLYSLPVDGTSWVSECNLPAEPVGLVSFRSQVWILYANNGEMQRYTLGNAASLTNVTGTNGVYLAAQYGSMLFYLQYSFATDTLRLNRYDPENPGAVPDLAVFPYGAGAAPPRSMVALGGDLFVTFTRSLWRFTSSNGNSGLLTGPLDSWTPTGGPDAPRASGAAVVFQGAVFYSIGEGLRRYVPGGQARTVWPTPERVTIPEFPSRALSIWDLAVVDDRLHLACAMSLKTDGTQWAADSTFRLLAWDGSGMHHIGSHTVFWPVYSSLDRLRITSVPWRSGRVFLGSSQFFHVPTSGVKLVSFDTSIRNGPVYVSSSTWISSRQDFGLLDIEKSLRLVGIAATAPAGMDVSLKVETEDGAVYSMIKVVESAFPSTGPPLLKYFRLPGPVGSYRVLVSKSFRFWVEFYCDNGTGVGYGSPQVYAINAIPNPINPLRRGGRLSFLIGEDVLDHFGNRLYAGPAEVAAALGGVKQFRMERYPLLLTWLDGTQLYVRFNTQTVRRLATKAGAEPVWAVDVDWQELS